MIWREKNGKILSSNLPFINIEHRFLVFLHAIYILIGNQSRKQFVVTVTRDMQSCNFASVCWIEVVLLLSVQKHFEEFVI